MTTVTSGQSKTPAGISPGNKVQISWLWFFGDAVHRGFPVGGVDYVSGAGGNICGSVSGVFSFHRPWDIGLGMGCPVLRVRLLREAGEELAAQPADLMISAKLDWPAIPGEGNGKAGTPSPVFR